MALKFASVIFLLYLCTAFYVRMREIDRQIVRLAVPSILANITIPLVGLVDTAIVGHISNAAAIGGVAIGTMLFDLLYWNFGFLRIGTSGLAAQAFGRGDRNECRRVLMQSLSISAVAALLIWLIQWLFVTLVLAVVPCSPGVAEVARRYFFIRIWAAPATLSLMAIKGWLIGMQDTRSAMVVDILVNVVNMAASYLLAVNVGLGVPGVAWGTFIAQYSGLLAALIILILRYRLQFRDFRLVQDCRWSEFFRLNGNLFIRSLCFMVVYVGYTMLASRYGDTELAVSSILMKLFMFFSYFVDGFAYAGEALVGRFIGEQSVHSADLDEQSRIPKCVRSLFAWSIGVGLFFTLVYALWGRGCFDLMTNDAEVHEAAMHYIGWLIAMPIVSTLAFMWDGIYVGATAGPQIRNSMLWAAAAFVICYLVTYRFAGTQALYLAYFAHLFVRVIYLSIEWKSTYELSQVRQ